MDRAKLEIGQVVRVSKRCHTGKEASVKKAGNDALPLHADRWQPMWDSLDEFEGNVFADGRNQPTEVKQRESFD